MNERTLTAMYDSRGAAETARTELLSLGVDSDAVSIRSTGSEGATDSAPNDGRGFWASLADLFLPDDDRNVYSEGVRRGGCLLSARVPEGLVDEASDILERGEPIDLDERAETWRQSGWNRDDLGVAAGGATAGVGLAEGRAGFSAQTASGDTTTVAASIASSDDEGVIPVIEEEVRVGKREVGRGSVRVRSYVVERPIEEQVSLRDEKVTIERRPVDRAVSAGDAAFQEREIEAVERGEEAVVSKTARVTEEVGIRKDVDSRTETIRDTVRKTEVDVDDARADRRYP